MALLEQGGLDQVFSRGATDLSHPVILWLWDTAGGGAAAGPLCQDPRGSALPHGHGMRKQTKSRATEAQPPMAPWGRGEVLASAGGWEELRVLREVAFQMQPLGT